MKIAITILAMTLLCSTCGGGAPLAAPPGGQNGNGKLRFVTTSPLPNAVANKPYSFQMQAAGGKGTCTWSGSNLPAGLTISASGLISGTPTAPVVNKLAVITYGCSK